MKNQGDVSFVLRLWLEPSESQQLPRWRWQVRHVQSSRIRYCGSLGDVLKFVSMCSGVAPPEPSEERR
ncbi:MAG: hypothetical protein L0177_02975 [Chloroflexi bacterium]|nr:hypothetical protein [Chloroflexota bacterium]